MHVEEEYVFSIHTALMLQETIPTQLETNQMVYVSYKDVANAFDSVWIDRFFCRLYILGIKGRSSGLLYKAYMD